MLRSAVIRDIAKDIDLAPGEQVVLVVQRHPVMLLIRTFPSLVVLIVAGGLAWFRSLGGTFLVTNAVERWSFTFLDRVLIGVILLGLLAWAFVRVRGVVAPGLRRALFGGAVVAAALLAFRLSGGRVFYIDPYRANGLDAINLLLSVLFLAAGAYLVYTYLDWANDQLIMTSERIILDNDKLLVRREQEQLSVDDIQNVLARTETYLEHWLNFGTITIQSAAVGNRVLFRAASNPLASQQQIMAELKRLKRQRNENELRRLLEHVVYNGGDAQAQPKKTHVAQDRQLGGVVQQNPRFDPGTQTYTWNPHWVLLVQALLRPVLLLALAVATLSVGARIGAISPDIIGLIVLPVGIFFSAWIAYRVADYRNERYVLSPTVLQDIAKKPLGPESRRSARLDALQNVYYRTTFVSQILGYGDVTVETAGAGGAFTFRAIPRPREVVGLIHDYEAAGRKREKERSLEASLILLREYHRGSQEAA
jgi:hypothetical protein